MWPFKKNKTKPKAEPPTDPLPPGPIYYSQVDITEHFGDDERPGPDDWIATTPLNKLDPDGQASGLPPADAADEGVYAVAARMSEVRESIPVPNDGVYCPICHIANVRIEKLRTPCPKCGRPLLKFGWS